MLPRFQSKFNLPYVATAFGVHHFQFEGQVKSVRHVKAALSTQCHQQEHRSQLTSAHQGISSKHRLLDRFLCIWSNDIIATFSFCLFAHQNSAKYFIKEFLQNRFGWIQYKFQTKPNEFTKEKIQNYYQLDAQKLVHWKIKQRHQMYISVFGYHRQIHHVLTTLYHFCVLIQ